MGSATEHHLAGEGEDQAQGEGAQGLVRLLELLADGDALRAMLLAFSALDALGGESRLFRECDGLAELEPAGSF